MDIMITWDDQQEVLEDYIASEVREQTEKKDKQTAKMLYDAGVPVETIANSLKRGIRIIEKWLGIVPQAY